MENQYSRLNELINGYFENSLSIEESKELTSLLISDKEMQSYFEDSSRSHALMMIPRFESKKDESYKIVYAYIHSRKKNVFRKRFYLVLKMTAVILFLLSVSFSSYLIKRDIDRSEVADTQYYRMEVPLGSQTKMILPDSTVVCLNSGSVLAYKPSFTTGKERDIYLSGEAYMEVFKDNSRPFVVHTDDLSVKVLGTKFNISAYQDDEIVEVCLLEGKVNVFFPSETIGNYFLSPNENLIYDKLSKKTCVGKADARNSAAWTLGKLSFVNAPLSTILKDIERIYNVRFEVYSLYVEKEIFTGSISTKLSIDEILQYIDVDNKYAWSHERNKIILRDK